MFEIECPSGLKFIARKFKGAELHSIQERVSPNAMGDTIADVLHGCHMETIDAGPYREGTASVGNAKPAFKRVLFKDAWAALLLLRNATFPNFAGAYSFEFHCSDAMCREIDSSTVPLDKLLARMQPLPEASFRRLQNGEAFESVVEGRRVKWDLPRMAQQAPMREFMKKNNLRADSALTQICRQLLNVEGAKLQRMDFFWKWAKELDGDSIDQLLYEMESADAKVDTRVVVQCRHCQNKQKIQLPLGTSFFRPRLEMLEDEMERDVSFSELSTESTTSSDRTDTQNDAPTGP